MKRKLFCICSIIVLLGTFLHVSAQTSAPGTKPQQVPAKKATTAVKKWQRPTATVDSVKNTDFSLNGQYQFMLSRSRSVNGYKLVNPFRLASVWKSAIDTVTKERAALKTLKAKVAEQEKTIASLQTEVKGNEVEVADSNAKVDEINFLGLSLTKSTYNIIVWSIIGVLALALIVIVARSGKNISEAKHRAQLYEEVSAEYQAFKVKSVEKERKLARELQDERNKIEEMRGRG